MQLDYLFVEGDIYSAYNKKEEAQHRGNYRQHASVLNTN